MSVRYTPYIALREQIADIYRITGNLPKTVKGPKFVEESVKQYLHLPGSTEDIGAGVLIDEEDFVQDGCRVYFPQSSELLRMLWKARMDVVPKDVLGFPRSFAVAWPDDFEIQGVKLPGCLVWFGSEKERNSAFTFFANKYFKGNAVPWAPKGRTYQNTDDLTISLSFSNKPRHLSVCRTVVPEAKMKECMVSSEKMNETLGKLSVASINLPFAADLNEEEKMQQYIMLKLVIHLMVYATACPDSVISGWPDKFTHRDCGKGWIKKFTPSRFLMPVRSRDGVSPGPHWRVWHFRQYPIKKDGTRQKGIVYVSGCLVNGHVDPKTVLEM